MPTVIQPDLGNIIYQPNSIGEVKSISALTPLLGYPRFKMDFEAGIFYLGKQRFTRAHWAYPLLPKWMQLQGRAAKEAFSLYNNSIWVTISEGDLRFHIRPRCDECGGEVHINADGDYYCVECGLMLGESTMLPGYDSLMQSSPMSDHNYST
jgi:hypothetical protein